MSTYLESLTPQRHHLERDSIGISAIKLQILYARETVFFFFIIQKMEVKKQSKYFWIMRKKRQRCGKIKIRTI